MKKIILLLLFFTLVSMSGCAPKISSAKEVNVDSKTKMEMNDVTFTIDKMERLNEVKPEKPSGYYNYYEEKKGYFYYVVSGTAISKSESVLDTDNILVRGIYKSKKYEGKLLFSNKEHSDLIKKLNKKEEQTFYFIVLLKDKQPLPNTLDIFYNENFEKSQKKSNYQYLNKWMFT